MQKQGEKHFFHIKAKKISLLLCFISLQSENDGSFRFFFVFFLLRLLLISLQISAFCIDAKQAKKALFSHRSKKILLPFRFVSVRSENDGAP
jgi:hypothetical protein